MKVLNFKPYISFASSNEKIEQFTKPESSDNENGKKEKLIKYTLAATAAAAIVIGGLYYLGRHGGSGLKKTNLSDDVKPNSKTLKPEAPDINVDGIKKSNADTAENVSNKQDLAEQVIKDDDKNISSEDNIIEDIVSERPKTKKTSRKRGAKKSENNINLSEIPDSKKPFVLDKKYFDFSKIEGERSDKLVKQFENGKLKREFASYDGSHLNYYSEFDDNGNRLIDVEFRNDTSVRSIIRYNDGAFSENSFYEKDGITLAQKFDNEDESLLFGLNFD